MNLYERIAKICSERKITIAELERCAGMPQATIAKWKTSSPSVDKLLKISKALNIPTDYLLGQTDEGIISIQRAREKMSDKDKEKMNAILKLAFEKEFSDN